MNDMSRPSQLRSSADHADHDVLLVSQLVAGDPLEPAEQRQATALVADCAECAALADDLRVLATAVAWEPIPPRRRDFRLSAEEAAQARGSALDRLMRRFTLPSASGLRPVAAGVMSLGLVLVIAGSFWPEDVFDDAVPQVAPVPALQAAPASGLTDSIDTQNLTLELESVVASEPPVAGSLSAPAQPEANTSEDAAANREATAGSEAAGDAFGQDASLASEAASELAAQQERSADQGPASKAAADDRAVDALAGTSSDAVEDTQRLEVPPETQAHDASSAADSGATASGGGGTSIESVVTLAGLGLLLAGLLLWLAVWVARRRDAGSYAR